MNTQDLCSLQEAYISIYETAPTSPADAVKKVNKKNFPTSKPPLEETAPTSPADAVKKVNKKNFPPRKPLEESDIFDIVKGHLIDEGFAETEEAALAIMASMSEEWRQSIISEVAGLIPLAGLAGTVIKKVRD